jgi:hypothetical protein
MKLFVRAVVTGFALSLGAALFKKVQKHLGLDPEDKKSNKPDAATEVTTATGATDPGLRHELS